jgi:hypothetical protein
MRRSVPRLLTLCSAAVPLLASGCGTIERQWYKQQVPWGYVFDTGGPKEITRWTLDQTDAERIGHGQSTLHHLASSGSRREARRAADGYLQVHRKLLDGWPGLKPSLMASGKLRDREHLIYTARITTKKDAEFYEDNPSAQELWRRLQEMDPEAALVEQPKERHAKPPPAQ